MIGCWVCRLNHDEARADTATAGVGVTRTCGGSGVELPHAPHRVFGRSSSTPLVGSGVALPVLVRSVATGAALGCADRLCFLERPPLALTET